MRTVNSEGMRGEWIKVLLFVGKNQSRLPFSLVKGVQCLGARAQYVEMSGTGHNALDFHIAFYIGRISASDKDAYFHIVSDDRGFDPLIDHLKKNRISADRIVSVEEIPALKQVGAVSKSTAEHITFAKDRLLKAKTARPRTRKTLASHVSAMFLKAISDDDVATVVDGLFKNGTVSEKGKRIEYSDERT